MTAWMNLKSIMLSKISQREKDNTVRIIYMWNLRNITLENRFHFDQMKKLSKITQKTLDFQ